MAARGESAAIEEGTRDTECPVCYECFGDTERTLSCGHVFCHDCLVKTLVSVSRDGLVKRENIICPICRHLTFICRRDALVAATTAGKGEGEEERAQTLEVPVPMSAGAPQHLFGDQDLTSPPANAGPSRAARYCRWISTKLSRPRFKSSNNTSQIFIISSEGRPMADADGLSVVTTTSSEPLPLRRQRRRICTTTRCLLILLSLFTVLTFMVASLPWILLA